MPVLTPPPSPTPSPTALGIQGPVILNTTHLKRPTTFPCEQERQSRFSDICATGDLTDVRSFLQYEILHPYYLHEGIAAAIGKRRLDLLPFLLDQTKSIDGIIANSAARARSTEIWEVLLEHGWDINAQLGPMAGSTLLSVLDDERLVRWFFDHGASLAPQERHPFVPDCADPFLTCLNMAACVSTTATFDLLLEHGASRVHSIPLHAAAGCGSDESLIPMMAHLIDIGFDINATDVDISDHIEIGTPLHYAVRRHAACKIKFLLENGADAHKSNGQLRPSARTSAYEMAKGTEMQEIMDMGLYNTSAGQ